MTRKNHKIKISRIKLIFKEHRISNSNWGSKHNPPKSFIRDKKPFKVWHLRCRVSQTHVYDTLIKDTKKAQNLYHDSYQKQIFHKGCPSMKLFGDSCMVPKTTVLIISLSSACVAPGCVAVGLQDGKIYQTRRKKSMKALWLLTCMSWMTSILAKKCRVDKTINLKATKSGEFCVI